MKKLLLTLGLSVFSAATWADCSQVKGVNYNKCVQKEFTKSQSELKEALNEQYSIIPDISKDAFKKAQAAWLTYREKECEYQQSLNSTGSTSPLYADIDKMNCTINLNQQRIKTILDN